MNSTSTNPSDENIPSALEPYLRLRTGADDVKDFHSLWERTTKYGAETLVSADFLKYEVWGYLPNSIWELRAEATWKREDDNSYVGNASFALSDCIFEGNLVGSTNPISLQSHDLELSLARLLSLPVRYGLPTEEAIRESPPVPLLWEYWRLDASKHALMIGEIPNFATAWSADCWGCGLEPAGPSGWLADQFTRCGTERWVVPAGMTAMLGELKRATGLSDVLQNWATKHLMEIVCQGVFPPPVGTKGVAGREKASEMWDAGSRCLFSRRTGVLGVPKVVSALGIDYLPNPPGDYQDYRDAFNREMILRFKAEDPEFIHKLVEIDWRCYPGILKQP